MNDINRKIFCDFDNTIVNSTKRICNIYNEDFNNHNKFKEAKWCLVNEWNFSDQCPLASKKIINGYFNEDRFFNDKLEFMGNAFEVIKKLSAYFNIAVISMGDPTNLRLKEIWLNNNLPFVKFIGCNFANVNDKSHIDMDGGTLIDDLPTNLVTSNATTKILYGDLYSWNKDWQGIHKWNWYEIYDYYLME